MVLVGDERMVCDEREVRFPSVICPFVFRPFGFRPFGFPFDERFSHALLIVSVGASTHG